MTTTPSMSQLSTLAHTMAVTHKVTHDHIASLDLKDLCVFIKKQEVIASTHTYLNQLMRGCLIWNGVQRPKFNINIRVFLSAYLLAIHRNAVLENINEDTTALVEASENLVRQFKRVTNVLLLADCHAARIFKERRVKELSKDFYDAVADYFPKFYAWKTVDEARLFVRITEAIWVLLRAKIITAGFNEKIDLLDPYVIQLDEKIENLRNKLQQICGTKTLVDFDALIASELANRRYLVLLRQEHARNVGEGPVFDLINKA